jgi:hypothetical protein
MGHRVPRLSPFSKISPVPGRRKTTTFGAAAPGRSSFQTVQDLMQRGRVDAAIDADLRR